MRPSNKSRSRNKSGSNNNRRNVGNIVNRVFESAGPDGKVRGTPQQIIDKYQVLARDAQVSGDRVAAENYLQHAEHYARLLGEAQRQMFENRSPERDDRDDRDDGYARGEPQGHGRPDFGERQQPPRPEPRRAEEPMGLVTIGHDDGDDAGPVETPEEAARHRAETEAATPPPPTNGEERPVEASQPAPKRPRTRRKAKPAAEPIEATAD